MDVPLITASPAPDLPRPRTPATALDSASGTASGTASGPGARDAGASTGSDRGPVLTGVERDLIRGVTGQTFYADGTSDGRTETGLSVTLYRDRASGRWPHGTDVNVVHLLTHGDRAGTPEPGPARGTSGAAPAPGARAVGDDAAAAQVDLRA